MNLEQSGVQGSVIRLFPGLAAHTCSRGSWRQVWCRPYRSALPSCCPHSWHCAWWQCCQQGDCAAVPVGHRGRPVRCSWALGSKF